MTSEKNWWYRFPFHSLTFVSVVASNIWCCKGITEMIFSFKRSAENKWRVALRRTIEAIMNHEFLSLMGQQKLIVICVHCKRERNLLFKSFFRSATKQNKQTKIDTPPSMCPTPRCHHGNFCTQMHATPYLCGRKREPTFVPEYSSTRQINAIDAVDFNQNPFNRDRQKKRIEISLSHESTFA